MWGHMSTTDLPGSSLLANRYRLVERLGAGGMSVVWRGFDEVLGRQVAVKVLPPSTSADPSFRRRLRAEAQAAARLSHPHITNVYDYGEATTVDGEPVPYVVMELVDGESLAAVLARSRRLPWPAAVRIAAEVSAALAAAHSRGIVHRDVTPANVMLTPSGAKVVDFGISALIGENDIDPDGSLLGTPAYLAPERLEGGQVSPATDVYAVGLLVYRTLIGQLPWDVGTTTALLRAHQYTEPDPLPPVEGLPGSVATLIARCLQKSPSERPSSAELAHVLGTVSAGVPAARAFVPDWTDNGEDTTILPSAHQYTEGVRQGRPGYSRLADAAPGRGVASVPPAPVTALEDDAPISPAPGAAQPVSVAEVEAAMGSNNAAPTSAPPIAPAPRAARNSRFGPVPPSPAAPASAGPVSPAGFDQGRSRFAPAPEVDDEPGRALRPAFNGIPSPRAESAPTTLGPAPAPLLPPLGRPAPAASPGRFGALAQRRRLLAVAGAVAGVAILAWAFTAVSDDGQKGIVTGAIAPAPAAVTSKCVVSYAVWSDDGGRFKAAVTIANRDVKAIDNWKLWFLMPGDQVVSGGGRLQLDQQARAVTVSSRTALNPQANTTMEVSGRYRLSNAAPMVFELDGKPCDTYVSPKPGEPSRPVEHLSNGTTRLGPVPSPQTPIPGISIDPSGVVVPVPVPTLPGGDPVPTTTSTSTAPTDTDNGGDGGTDPDGSNGGDGDGDGDEGTPAPSPPAPSVPSSQPVTTGGEGSPSVAPPSAVNTDTDDADLDDADADTPGATG
ncbi:hypothetical protein GCM10010435_01690 [Winogradskya consettensis]|uniref:non-specific serine/threonine protein kinase n=2 Tax=Winogradskya consettensis TaxID=113560 RepID=A0A919VK81_9ACTN|nr:hypothetical protein Aco04nite_01260 [Actinoplanes consettensis]